jgi:regulator of RNase E activity RraA
MQNAQLHEAFVELSTPLIADACVRLDIELRLAPAGISSIIAGQKLAGRVLPARHFGSVDVFLEAYGSAEAGDVLVIDNQNRMDEGCIGDLTVLEAQAHGVAGIIVWGAHRDTAELIKIGVPVFSYASYAAGPRRLYAREFSALISAHVGEHLLTRDDVAFADSDGVIFVPYDRIEEILNAAQSLHQKEREQVAKLTNGETLRQQFQFETFLAEREKNPSYSFRAHLRAISGAIEE